jgi:hypothetical protein
MTELLKVIASPLDWLLVLQSSALPRGFAYA